MTDFPREAFRQWLAQLAGLAPSVQAHGLERLAGLGEELKALRPEPWEDDAWLDGLIGLLRHRCPHTRRKAAEVLSCLGPDAAAAVAALEECLTDADRLVRRWAARALGEIGADARPAVPSLQTFQTSPDIRDRAVATVALRKILPELTDS